MNFINKSSLVYLDWSFSFLNRLQFTLVSKVLLIVILDHPEKNSVTLAC